MTTELSCGAEDKIHEEWKRKFFEQMRSRHSQSVKLGMAKCAEAGFHLHRVPIGYRRVWRGETFEIEPDPVQSVHVYQAFCLMATGKYSIRKLLALMTEQGLRTVAGKNMSISSFHVMLSNPFYSGLIRCGMRTIQGRHTRIVGQELWERANHRLAEGSLQ